MVVASWPVWHRRGRSAREFVNMPGTPGSSRLLWWLLVVVTGAVLAWFARAGDSFRALGINHLGPWFLDLQAILASGDAVKAGLDPYAANPLDLLGRPHTYSHWWLGLGRMGFTRADAPMLGFLLGAAFIVTALARLRPGKVGELIWSLLVLCSPPVLLALDRANNDLVIFVLLAPVVPCLLATRPWVRWLAVPLVIGAGALKVYPLIAGFILLAGTSPRDTRRLVLSAALLLAIVLPDLVSDFFRYSRNVPDAQGLTTLGARNLLVGVGVAAPLARLLAVALGALVVAGILRAKVLVAWTVAPGDRGAWLSFVLGAVLVTGCFFAGTSYAYRWIFSLWMVPLLWRLPRDRAAPAGVRRLAAATAGLLAFALWADSLWSAILGRFSVGTDQERIVQLADRIFYFEQPVVWAFFACLLAFLTHFAQHGLRSLFRDEPAVTPPAPGASPSR